MPDLDTFTRHEKLKAAARIWSTNAGHQYGTHHQPDQVRPEGAYVIRSAESRPLRQHTTSTVAKGHAQ